MVLRKMDVAWVKLNQASQGHPQWAMQLVCTPPASSDHKLPGGGGGDDRSSAFYLVDDVYQARITKRVGVWKTNLGWRGHKIKMDWLIWDKKFATPLKDIESVLSKK